MTTFPTEDALLKEFLVDRSYFNSSIPYSRFKNLFPSGISEVAIEDIYNHLKKINHTARRELEDVIDSSPITNKIPTSSLNQLDDVNKVINNMIDLDNIVEFELQRVMKEREEQIDKLKKLTYDIKEDSFEIHSAGNLKESAVLHDIEKALESLQDK